MTRLAILFRYNFQYFRCSKFSTLISETWQKNTNLLDFSAACEEKVKNELSRDMQVLPDFITPEEEISLMEELEMKFKRARYQYDHWDDAIHGYRETEKPSWNKQNTPVLDRLKQAAFSPDSPTLECAHVLDLSEKGHIKPHLDSIKYCGNTIAGISLLSPSVMRLVNIEQPDVFVSAHLPRRSLYIMKDVARYKFNHEILDNSVSVFREERILKSRRVSIICRSQPISNDLK